MTTPVKTRIDGHPAYKLLLPGVLLGFVAAKATKRYTTAIRQDGSLTAPLIQRSEAPFLRSIQHLLADAMNAPAGRPER